MPSRHPRKHGEPFADDPSPTQDDGSQAWGRHWIWIDALTFGELRADFGATFVVSLGQLWAIYGRLWANFGPALDRRLGNFGQLWGDFGMTFLMTLGQLCRDFWEALGQHLLTLGQLLIDFGSNWAAFGWANF